jgi:hypothetical protein
MKKNVFLIISIIINLLLVIVMLIYSFTPLFDMVIIQKSIPRFCAFVKKSDPIAYKNVALCHIDEQPVNQTQPTTPAQPATNQPSDNQTKNGIVYTNTEYKFQIVLSEAYRDYKVAEIPKNSSDSKFDIRRYQFNIKTTDKGYADNGYYEPSFTLIVGEASNWDKTADCKNVDWRELTCYNKEFLLGRRDKFVFYYLPSQDRSPAGLKVIEDFLLSGKIKQAFQLL